jgi:hypothetical protein
LSDTEDGVYAGLFYEPKVEDSAGDRLKATRSFGQYNTKTEDTEGGYPRAHPPVKSEDQHAED